MREGREIAPPAADPQAEEDAKMLNIMLDLETLGTGPGCVPLSIGAIAFDPVHGLGRHFYEVVSTRSCVDRYKLRKDASTLKWWDGQDSEARKVLQEAEESKLGLGAALQAFAKFCDHFDRSKLCIWGNGSDFDNAIMAYCYHVTDLPLPWRFYNNRCFRTLRNLHGGKPGRAVKHNALTDATDQAREAITYLNRMKG